MKIVIESMSFLAKSGLVVATILLVACTTKKDQNIPMSSQLQAADNISLAIKYIQKGKSNLAKQKLLKALKVAPNYAPAWYTMAYYLEATGMHKEARKYYERAISISPQHGSPYNNYGTFLCRRGQYKEAIEQFVTATRQPNYLNAATAYENAAACALKIPDRQLAINLLSKAVKLDPSLNPMLTQLQRRAKRG